MDDHTRDNQFPSFTDPPAAPEGTRAISTAEINKIQRQVNSENGEFGAEFGNEKIADSPQFVNDPEMTKSKLVDTPVGEKSEFNPTSGEVVPTTPIQDVVTESGKFDKPGNKYTFIIFLLFVVSILVWVLVGIIYKTNLDLKIEKEIEKTEEAIVEEKVYLPSEEIKITNGNVVRVDTVTGETNVLVSKSDYLSVGITGFVNVLVSPSEEKMCFVAIPPAPAPVLYVSKIDGTEVVKVGDNRNICNWSGNSERIVYLNNVTDVSPIDVFMFDMTSSSEINLTTSVSSGISFVRKYQSFEWSKDFQSITAKYVEYSLDGKTILSNGESTIDLSTLEVVDAPSVTVSPTPIQ